VNPLLAQWEGPFGGVPPFGRVTVGDFEPAFGEAMALQLAEVERIAADPAPPTFENTLAALERGGRAFERVRSVYAVHSATLKTPDFQAVERAMAPKLSAFNDRIVQNARLFERIAAVYDARERSGLTPEQQRLAWNRHTDFVRAGAALDAPSKERLAAINARLATLYTAFSQNVLADEERFLLLDAASDLAGLPESLRACAAALAAERGHAGKWAILNTRSSVEPFLAFSARRELREKVWRAFYSRGDNGDAHDNKESIREIMRLRGERARLLGYPTHAHWRTAKSMGRSPERALALMEAVWKPAVARSTEEVADMQAEADRDGAGITIAPWDYRFYAERVRKARFEVDNDEVMPYLQLEQLREAMFWVAGELLELRFAPRDDVPVIHPDVRVWEVSRGGRHVGLFFFDPYARQYQATGAWMSIYRSQERFDGEVTTIVSNNCNYVKGAPGEPVLVSWDDATTLFHEFGHALHGLSSSVSYPSLSGTNVDRDYVEFPSQLLESWLATAQVLKRFALHCRTGEPIPDELVARIERARRFNKGFENVEYVAAAIVDMRLHLLPDVASLDIEAFERETLAALGMPPQIVMRHRLPHFGHLFSGDSYSAGYYSYLWADTLSADAFEAFEEAGGAYDKNVAHRLHEHVFAAGNTRDPAEGYRAFRGRDAGIEALMRKRGFPHAGASTDASRTR
jgi:peptidyl-dipeptidase Dcp